MNEVEEVVEELREWEREGGEGTERAGRIESGRILGPVDLNV